MYELAEKFLDYQREAHKRGFNIGGSIAFTKMLSFAKENNINNIDVDFYMSLPPYKQEDETKEDLKIRSKFAKALYKYRPFIYNYSIL
ncbi:MAG: hypothetical protein JSS98_13060 [Bacteroidetes bacterium]|nr:hypothetical protein [Bacteroidota bacterium]